MTQLFGVEVPTDSIASGAIMVLFDAITRTWPVCVAIAYGIWKMSRFTKSVESFAASQKETNERIDRRLDSHSETLDRFGERISKGEASTTILLNHTGLAAP